MIYKLRKFNMIDGLIFIIYLCIFVVPSFYINGLEVPITKYIYLIYILFMYLVMSLRGKKSNEEIVLLLIFIVIAFLNRSLNILNVLGVLVCYRLLNEDYIDKIRYAVLHTPMNYVAIFMTLFYSMQSLWNGEERILRTAIGAINQSGMAVLGLGLIFRKKRKWMGNLILAFGMLSLSRNYVLAILLLVIFNLQFMKNMVYKMKLQKKFNFFSITFISTIILLIIGIGYQYLYKIGAIGMASGGIGRIFNLFDKSNYFRFTANMYLVYLFLEHPILLLRGIPDLQIYQNYCYEVAEKFGYFYVGNTPHNFFFSYLRIYGGFIVIIFFYLSRIMKKILNVQNFGAFIAIMSFAIFLSIGFNSFWLFFTVFILIVYGYEERKKFNVDFNF